MPAERRPHVAHSRRNFTKLLGTLGASSMVWDSAVADVAAQGTLSDDSVRAMLAAQGGAGIFANPERFAELKSALERAALRVNTMRAFPVPADVAPVVTFSRD
jgi:hypothetical protein